MRSETYLWISASDVEITPHLHELAPTQYPNRYPHRYLFLDITPLSMGDSPTPTPKSSTCKLLCRGVLSSESSSCIGVYDRRKENPRVVPLPRYSNR